VFLLKVDEVTLRKRLNSPTRNNLFAKDPATQDELAKNLNNTQRKITEKGATVIDAMQPIEIIVNHILRETR
jgi:thymidylate kinase